MKWLAAIAEICGLELESKTCALKPGLSSATYVVEPLTWLRSWAFIFECSAATSDTL